MDDRRNSLESDAWIDGECRWFYGGTPPDEPCGLVSVTQPESAQALPANALFPWRIAAMDELTGPASRTAQSLPGGQARKR